MRMKSAAYGDVLDCSATATIGGRVANPLQERFAEVLLARISGDRHPSSTHMAMLESVASDRVMLAYTLHLIEKIENDPNPSIPMLARVQRLIAQFGD